jgi:hypothetical protein
MNVRAFNDLWVYLSMKMSCVVAPILPIPNGLWITDVRTVAVQLMNGCRHPCTDSSVLRRIPAFRAPTI